MPKRALVVDNDYFFTEFLGEFLGKRGYEVVKAYDGKEGLSRLEENRIDLLFVDLIMPKIDGEKFIRLVRNRYPDRPFPIIVVSATIVEHLDLLKERRADFYVAKGPLEPMADQINSLLDRIEAEPLSTLAQGTLVEPGVHYPRQATIELLDMATYRQAIIDCLGVGVVLADKDAKIVDANAQGLRIMDLSLEEVLNRPVTLLFHARKDQGRLIQEMKRVVQEQHLNKSTFSVEVGSQHLFIVVSLMRTGGKISGWTIVLVEMQ